MTDLKPIIARNISNLRQARGMTQIELAERLNYSDKAVSKWERGESVPDISVLKDIAGLFGVSLDYLVCDNDKEAVPPIQDNDEVRKNNRRFITAMSIILVWLIAIVAFVVLVSVFGDLRKWWFVFIYAAPVSAIVWLVFNSLWFNRRLNFFIISILMWSVLATIYITLLRISNLWLVFTIGIPGQIIILLWSGIRKNKS